MNSIIAEISKLRADTSLVIDYKNSNRYRIIAIEPNGSKTAYYFNTPIYNDKTRKLIDMKFHPETNTVYAIGSNADISISNNICIENSEGSCIISLVNCINQIIG